MGKKKILVIGANGQIGAVLTTALRDKYGSSNVIASDIRASNSEDGPFELLDILDYDRLTELISKYNVNQIYHLAAILSAKGEENPEFTWKINMTGLFNVLNAAKSLAIERVFFPSSIAVFGSKTPRLHTPQDTVLNPSTVYGISKLAGEQWCSYYAQKYQLDIRSIRYPGIISYQSMPGGGTTDYAVDIFHKAILDNQYTCFLKADTRLPMIYMADAIRATTQLMETPKESLPTFVSYNITGMSFTPRELTEAIQKYIPNFSISYKPDFRQAIADSWTDSIDDQQARKDWGWKPNYLLDQMVYEMIEKLSFKYKKQASTKIK